MNWLIDRIVVAVLSWLADKGIRLARQADRERAIDKKARDDAEELKRAKNEGEFDRAAKDIISN